MLKRFFTAMVLLILAHGSANASECPDTLDYSFKKLGSSEVINFCNHYSGQVLLVVNTASKCAYTDQYEGLESLYKEYNDGGLVVIGFPSNDFGNQEPGVEKQIKSFCRLTYGVKFPMFEKIHVAEGLANKLYEHYAKLAGEYPGWNFHKYLINRDGQLVGSFESSVEPNDPKIVRAIERLL